MYHQTGNIGDANDLAVQLINSETKLGLASLKCAEKPGGNRACESLFYGQATMRTLGHPFFVKLEVQELIVPGQPL